MFLISLLAQVLLTCAFRSGCPGFTAAEEPRHGKHQQGWQSREEHPSPWAGGTPARALPCQWGNPSPSRSSVLSYSYPAIRRGTWDVRWESWELRILQAHAKEAVKRLASANAQHCGI